MTKRGRGVNGHARRFNATRPTVSATINEWEVFCYKCICCPTEWGSGKCYAADARYNFSSFFICKIPLEVYVCHLYMLWVISNVYGMVCGCVSMFNPFQVVWTVTLQAHLSLVIRVWCVAAFEKDSYFNRFLWVVLSVLLNDLRNRIGIATFSHKSISHWLISECFANKISFIQCKPFESFQFNFQLWTAHDFYSCVFN